MKNIQKKLKFIVKSDKTDWLLTSSYKTCIETVILRLDYNNIDT